MKRELRQIAERIKRWRTDAELTLQDLADRSSVSASTIHKIENSATVPTIAVLLKIARGLQRRPDELLVDDEAEMRASLMRPADRVEMRDADGIVVERMAGQLPGSILELWRSRLESGQKFGYETGRAPWQYDGEVIILVEAGRLSVDVGDERHELASGDSLHFRTDIRHGWRNDGSETARALFFAVVPRGLRGGLPERASSRAEEPDGAPDEADA